MSLDGRGRLLTRASLFFLSGPDQHSLYTRQEFPSKRGLQFPRVKFRKIRSHDVSCNALQWQMWFYVTMWCGQWTEVCHWQKKSLSALTVWQNWTSILPKTETWHCPVVSVWIYEVINILWVSTFSLDTKPMALMKDRQNYAGTIRTRKTTLSRWTPAYSGFSANVV